MMMMMMMTMMIRDSDKESDHILGKEQAVLLL
jgi:hypothetical protein